MKQRNIQHTAWIRIRGNVPEFAWRTSDHGRLDTTLHLIQEIYNERDEYDVPEDADFFFFADDIPPADIHPMFAYCSTPKSSIFSIPCGVATLFGYHVRLDEWANTFETNGVPFEEMHDTLYWIGGHNPYREHIVNIVRSIPYTDASFSSYPNRFIPLIEQGKYKYMLDMQGIGWSGRLMALCWMGSVLFVLDRDLHEFWFHANFKPWVHYVPVAHDASDLEKNYKLVRSMPDKGLHIAVACREKAREILNERFMKQHVASCIRQHSQEYGCI